MIFLYFKNYNKSITYKMKPNMKKLFYLICLLCIWSCEKDDAIKTKGFDSVEDILANPSVENAIWESGILIYKETSPPNIEGTYRSNEGFVTMASLNLKHMIDLPLGSYITFSNQVDDKVDIAESSQIGNAQGKAGFLRGTISSTTKDYTIFIEATNSQGQTVIAIQTGWIHNNDIDMQGLTVITDPGLTELEAGDWWSYNGPLRKKQGNRGQFTDMRDGKEYNWTNINNQTWMAENLSYYTSQSTYYFDNDEYANYGRYYTYEEACKVCPDGWHLPTLEEYLNVIQSYSNTGAFLDDTWYYWSASQATNESGLTIYSRGEYARYWTSSPFDIDKAYAFVFSEDNSFVGESEKYTDEKHLVRCVKD